jgi:hypothetical protein
MGAGIMKMHVGHSVATRLSAALLCASFGLVSLAGPVAGSSLTFGTPSATSKFNTGIAFSQPYSGGTLKSATILITTPGDIGPSVSAVDQVASSPLTFTMDTSAGGLFPNTPVVAHFEVVLSDGTTQAGPDIHVTYTDDRYAWKTMTGKVVTLHYINASASFAQQLVGWADDGVSKAATLFGVSESKPIDYFVYPDQSSFQSALGQGETVGGVAMPTFRSCFALVASGDTTYGQEVLAHEVTHVVFADAIGNPYHDPPRWLDEGFAVYNSVGYGSSDRRLVSQAASSGTLMSILALSDFFPLDANRIYLAYAEAVSAVDFMVRKYGQPAVLKLVQAYAKGDSDDEAFTAGLGVDMAAFNSAWLADNNATATKYGPQPEPTGPLPPGWNGTSASSGGTPGPSGGNGPGASTSTSGSGQQSPSQSGDQTVFLLAGIMAAAGLLLLGIALVLFVSSARRPVS